MSTSSPSRLQGLQQLRFFAAFAVLVHHILEEASASPFAHLTPAIERVGASGVDVFFVISGFVMWHTTRGFSRSTSPKRFFVRRVSRIMPPYWACLALVVALWWTGALFKSMSIDGPRLLQSMLLLPPTTSGGMIWGVSWTLVYEFYFYLVCTAALLLPWEKRRTLFIAALLVALPFALNAAGARIQGGYYGNPIVAEFVFGIALGWAAPKLPKRRAAWLLLAVCAVLLYWASAASPDAATYGLRPSLRWWAWGLPATLAVAAFTMTNGIGGTTGRALIALGDSSYVLYLTHGLLMIAFARTIKAGVFHGSATLYAAAFVIACGAVVFAHGLHVVAERPLLAWFQRKEPRVRGSVLT
ncbi:acyltransferase family protein [Paraburkholderia caballeronis]|uniref:Peptidoglycan/LPS O-acetylase OafA/YrhL, contains acyltransferase and SGNH-hydrolase domains n=1 Tax=Paraburkholderia caballeronis TaxID=416943 RepID=A0A1H7JVF0_9BURK|nr:acyltransferase [Paraburkholderia caballeronis]PXW27252.1 peptidoglycan/LPS O-acetylase OafA/YrhL [Paraburkholderia caballeronis]PXX02726.1 peptidoglycan/LPS O-acetylase OafA/YrhL [Paraburkholderia caballeronis]RAK03451.1 peptidoglycan/LPS O-acetylase OafA/YrhL [Paraburkholderia caballeronis]SEC39897.1 Peptidoglycan/LPS O-acetylase OafA/YrhL, contains acyltransferase and SGNH-hydrolase domains [Paraburkholderia caballeronis]SEK78563.1 Peptidoglycan/LPS O-acetylase OafA/YrhL, contains acyltr